MDVEPSVLAEPNPDSADSLLSTNNLDDLANEQTWPTEEEMQPDGIQEESDLPDAHPKTTPKAVKKIPKGMSEYQASWIVDESDEDDEEGHELASEEVQMEAEEEMEVPVEHDHDMDGQSVAFQDLDEDEEAVQYVHVQSECDNPQMTFQVAILERSQT